MVQKNQFWPKNWNFERNVDLFKQLCTTTESDYVLAKHVYFYKNVTVWMSIATNKVFISDKTFIIVFLLLENCYFDSKYHFIQRYFGQKCHFPSKIHISLGINYLDKLNMFFEKGINIAVSFGKNNNWF